MEGVCRCGGLSEALTSTSHGEKAAWSAVWVVASLLLRQVLSPDWGSC